MDCGPNGISSVKVSKCMFALKEIIGTLYCYERDIMLSRKSDTQADIIEAFNSTSRYLDDIFNTFLDTLFPFINPKEVCLNETNESNVSAPFLDADLPYVIASSPPICMTNEMISISI